MIIFITKYFTRRLQVEECTSISPHFKILLLMEKYRYPTIELIAQQQTRVEFMREAHLYNFNYDCLSQLPIVS